MRKFLPRFLNVICFLVALIVFLPWYTIAFAFADFSVKLQSVPILSSIFLNMKYFLVEMEWVKFAFIPSILVIIALIYFIHASIDKKVKGFTTQPLSNMALDPILYYGIAASLSGLLTVLFLGLNGTYSFAFHGYDYYTLMKFLPAGFINVISNVWIGIGLYAVLFIAQLIILLTKKKLFKRGFVARLLLFLLVLVLGFLSIKGIYESALRTTDPNAFSLNYIELLELRSMFTTGHPAPGSLVRALHSYVYPIRFQSAGWKLWIIYALTLVLLIVFIVVASKLKKRANKDYEEAKAIQAVTYTPYKEGEADTTPSEEDLPKPEEEVVAVEEDNEVVETVTYEKSNINEVFETEFGFKNDSMVKSDGEVSYFVNKQKFLTLDNEGKKMTFRLELEKAIKLIIEYPIIGKDRYQNNRIWFKIDDVSILNKDVIIQIVKEAYNTVLRHN